MKYIRLIWFIVFCTSHVLLAQKYTQYVNPFIGTGGHGHTFPGACYPFGMVQLSPDTRLEGWDGCSGYHYSDSIIYGFSHTHLSGTGVPDYCDILFMPGNGPHTFQQGGEGKVGYASAFKKKREFALPAYYSVFLEKYGIKVELTAGPRTGMHRYHFPNSAGNWIIIDLKHRDKILKAGFTACKKNEINGFRISQSWAKEQHVYFSASFSAGITQCLFNDDSTQLILFFEPLTHNTLTAHVGISSVNNAGAIKNLHSEWNNFNFKKTYTASRKTWDQLLSRIDVEDKEKNKKIIFYTALYHTLIHPSLSQDIDGSYRGLDQKIYVGLPNQRYTVFSLWDTYRAAHPLYQLVYPEYNEKFIHTFLQQFDEVGRLPVWELSSNETYCMIGNHAIPVITNAWMNGSKNFNIQKMVKAVDATMCLSWHSALEYMKEGFIPANFSSESVSKTIENSLDVAASTILGATKYPSILSAAYKNMYNPESGFFQAKINHSFVSHFNPKEVNQHYTEANAYQYLFGAHHDIEGMIQCISSIDPYEPDFLVKSRRIFGQRLDSLFFGSSDLTGRVQSDITGLIGQYAHGNEPSHHIAYLYNYAGQPYKTQELIYKICKDFYTNAPDGLIGNEDCGQMSAWYVFSSMGFYPVNPLTNYFDIGLPQLDKVKIKVPSKKDISILVDKKKGQLYVQNFTRPKEYRRNIQYGDCLTFELTNDPTSLKYLQFDSSSVPKTQLWEIPLPYVRKGERVFTDSTVVELVNAHQHISFPIEYCWDTIQDGVKIFNEPITIYQNSKIFFRNRIADPTIRRFGSWLMAEFSKAPETGRLITLTPYDNQYHGGSSTALLDGIYGSDDFRDGFWQGWWGKDIEIVVELKENLGIHSVGVSCLEDQKSWIFFPESIEFLGSSDNQLFVPIGSIKHQAPVPSEWPMRKEFILTKNLDYTFIKIKIKNAGLLPSWHLSHGNNSWLFVDELIINK